MSNTDDFGSGAGAAAGPGSTPRPPFACEAHELKGLLQRIANHIADADRRHCDALSAVQEQLAELGREAGGGHGRQQQDLPGPDLVEESIAAGGASTAGTAEGLRPADRLDPVEASRLEGEREEDEPWDQASADALADIYESGEAGFAVRPEVEADTRVESRAAMGVPPVQRAEEESPLSMDAARDRAWLEERCAEIASRVEEALAATRRECSFVDYGDRLERLENRLGAALGETATRADLEILETIEAQILELTRQLDTAQARLARLDAIETELRVLSEQVSDQRLGELIGRAAPAMPGVEAMAQLVADRVSGQLPQLDELRAEERKRFDELHELVEGFLSERREGDQQTATVLDTMQQSIMRLLDRMDAVESATLHAPASASTFEEDAPRATGLREQAATPGSGRQGTHAEQDVQRQSAGREQRYDPAIYQMYPEPSADGPGNQARAEPFAARSTRSRTEDAMPSSWHGERLGFVPPRQSPEDVVAVARRALRQAAQAAAEAGEEATVSQASQTEAQARKPAATHRSGTVARTWLPSRLVIATIVLIAVGATFTIATILRKTVVGDTIERMLLTPEPDEHDANGRLQNGKQDAGRRGLGGEFDKAGEGTQEPGSGSDRAPSLKQRTGEPPQNMHASTNDEGRLPQPQLDTAQPNAGGDLRQSRVPETDGPDPARSLPATAVANLPDGISLQETGSIIGAAQLLQLQHLQHTASLSSRLGAAQVPAPALPTALTPDGAASVPDAAAKDAGLSSGARSHSILPPAAVGPQSLRVAAANGDPSAEFEVGTRLSEGRGLPQDLEQAAVWYQRAATRGFAPAQYRLATLHELGLGVPTDLARARVWYLRAAEQGHAKAMHNIAVMSASGRPGAPDYAAAIDWFTKAAERGLTDSQYNLGVLYESGLGVPRDPKEAYRWFALAAQAGDQEAARRRDMLRPRLAAAELQAADREVQSWRATPVDTLINDPRAAGEAWKQGNPAGRAE